MSQMSTYQIIHHLAGFRCDCDKWVTLMAHSRKPWGRIGEKHSTQAEAAQSC